MENNIIIEAKNIFMCFNLAREKTDTLKEFFIKLLKRNLFFDKFYALRDVSFSIKKGDAIALIGVNGSGKSTMLKIIAGVMKPTSGEINIRGTIAPLIKLSAGFDIDLTARENIFLNSAVLGHSREYMKKHFNEIVSFAELEDFIDVPIKNFSSGMIARLGFSIATIVNADILVVDEILAVGDYKFQEKCKNRIKKMLESGTTLLFVSHDINQVKELCNKAIWLDHGILRKYGDIETICNEYAPNV